ncbi:hypothetical protein TW84_01590 [Vibrio neptunius]|nr:hypothetical protein [Vibrio neptunius]KJY93965.1 hypothetical protein TW84_01590 [Vibrio neptunius]
MGKGGSSSSSNTTQTTNVSGTNAVSGDNLGVLLSGVNGSTVNVTATDHGAVKAASNMAESSLDFGRDALKSNENAVHEALKMGGESLSKSFSFGEESMKNAMSISRESLDKMENTSKGAIDAVKSMAAKSSENARTAIAMADKAKAHEQTGNAPEMTKIVYGVLIVMTIGGIAVAVRGSA